MNIDESTSDLEEDCTSNDLQDFAETLLNLIECGFIERVGNVWELTPKAEAALRQALGPLN